MFMNKPSMKVALAAALAAAPSSVLARTSDHRWSTVFGAFNLPHNARHTLGVCSGAAAMLAPSGAPGSLVILCCHLAADLHGVGR